ncbi:MAG TPA: DUF4160 domain-containing protein [Stellaceae bacterium]|jgi:hypothetical protein|nr:DUF4160 domain-containing protein [Stellaceae bacterium]
MPTVFRDSGFRFFFYSDEGNPREPPHIHVRASGSEAKVWLRRGLPHAYNHGFSTTELRRIRSLIEAHREQIEAAWNEHFD